MEWNKSRSESGDKTTHRIDGQKKRKPSKTKGGRKEVKEVKKKEQKSKVRKGSVVGFYFLRRRRKKECYDAPPVRMAQPTAAAAAPPVHQASVGHQDTLAVPPMPKHAGLNEDLVKILRENLLQQHERPRSHRRSPSSISPRLSPRNSPRLLRRMMLNNNIHKQRRFTVAHTW